MKFAKFIPFALAAGAFFTANSASAAYVYLDAGAGHLHLSNGDVNWTDTFAANYQLKIRDGREIFLAQPPLYSTYLATWIVHIPLSGTDATWSSMARGNGDLAHLSQRICSFDADGNYYNCGSTVGVGSYSNVLVLSGGTAFSQSFLKSECVTGYCGTSGILAAIRAHN
jgi:hypothetical protein